MCCTMAITFKANIGLSSQDMEPRSRQRQGSPQHVQLYAWTGEESSLQIQGRVEWQQSSLILFSLFFLKFLDQNIAIQFRKMLSISLLLIIFLILKSL
ncbi:hypothetical protein I3760_08G136100 [Carya illinoinensis]|nr:hypothetical protein I3760_08G136100 [Carya illinoinensis]